MGRQAPFYYVAIRRKVATSKSTTTKTESEPRKPRPAGRKRVRPEAILAAYRPAAVVFKRLPQSRTRDLVRLAMSLAQQAATSLDPHTADLARAKAAAAADKSFKELTDTDLAGDTTGAMFRLIEALKFGSSRGGRVRGDRGLRPRPSHEAVDISGLVTGFSFEDQERKVDKVTFTLDNYDLKHFDPASRLISKGDTIEYSFGYVDGDVAPIREAVVKKVTGGTSLSVEAHSKDVLMDKVKYRKTYRNVTRSDVVRIIADRNGYAEEQLAVQETEKVFESISQPNLSDAVFLRKLANRQGFEFYVDFDGFHWHERNVSQAPIRTLKYFLDESEGDIISFSTENDVTRRPGRVRVKGRNPETGEEFTAEASNATHTNRTALQPVTDTKTVLSFDGVSGAAKWEERGDTAYDHDVVDSHAETLEEAQVIANKRFTKAQQVAVKLTLEVVGDPLLVGKSVVIVEHLSGISGRYYVKNVTHSISGDYRCSVELITDGFGAGQRGKGGGKGAEGNNALGVALERWITTAKIAEMDVRKEKGVLSAGILSRASKGVLTITENIPLSKDSAREGAKLAGRFIGHAVKQSEADSVKSAVVAAGEVMRYCKLVAVSTKDEEVTAATLNEEPSQDAADAAAKLQILGASGAVKR